MSGKTLIATLKILRFRYAATNIVQSPSSQLTIKSTTNCFLSAVVCAAMVFAGCSAWKTSQPDANSKKSILNFGNQRLSPSSVSVELAVAQFDDSQASDIKQLWNQLDQQILPLSVRKLLDQNGLRVAVVPSNVPALMQKLLEPIPVDVESLDELQLHLYEQGRLPPESRLITSVHRQILKDKTFMLNVSPHWPLADWVLHDGSQEYPGAAQSVEGVFELKTHPQGDGSVRLEIIPKLYHGEKKTRIGVSDGDYVFQSNRDSIPLRPIHFDVNVLPGQTILIGPTEDVDDLGRLFFSAEERKNSSPTAPQFNISQSVDLNELDELAIQMDQSSDERLETEKVDEDENLDLDSVVTDMNVASAKPKPLHRVLLIRVVRSQKDDLFSTQQR